MSIPLKHALAQVVGFLKGKRAVHIARTSRGRKRNFTGEHVWTRGYFAPMVGRDERVIREYIRRQEEEDRRLEKMNLLD